MAIRRKCYSSLCRAVHAICTDCMQTITGSRLLGRLFGPLLWPHSKHRFITLALDKPCII